MSDDRQRAGENRFARHRRKTIAVLFLGFALLFDTVGASLLDAARARIERRHRQLEAQKPRKKPDPRAPAGPALDSAPPNDELLYRRPSSVLHHDLIPNASVERAAWNGRYYPVRVNSLGLRDRVVREVPLAKHPRLLLVGDSFTEGIGLRYEETFAGRLEDELAKDGVDVLNAGVASYAPSIYLLRVKDLLEEKHLELDTIAVFLDLSDIPDEAIWYDDFSWKDDAPAAIPQVAATGAPAAEIPPPAAPAPPLEEEEEDPDLKNLTGLERVKRFIWLHSLAARAAIALKVRVFPPPPDAPPKHVVKREVGCLDSPRSRWTVDPELFEDYGRKGLRRCAIAMDRLAELCRSRKLELILVIYPWPDQIDTHDLDSVHVRFWRAWAERQKVPFFDLFPVFISDENKYDVYERYFIPGDSHWNAAGHALVAREFLARYRGLHAK